MFRDMRRDEKQLTEKKAVEILKEGEYGVLATIGSENYPYALPLNYIYYNNKIYLHCAQEGHKLDNIKNNNKVSFTVVGDYELQPAEFTSKYESVVIFGQANMLEGKAKEEVLNQFILKFSPQFKSEGFDYVKKAAHKTAIIEIKIEDLKGKRND
jgi:hypothetical protein